LPKGTEVAAGEIVYLKPKRRRGSEAQHTVSKDENMRDISQKYGIKLKQLYKKNRMDYGTQPKAGEVLNMQKKRSSDDKVTLAEKDPEWKEDKKEFVNPHSLPKTIEVDTTKAGAINKKDLKNPDYHVVQKGDNIYRIAEKYRVFEEDLLIWNANLNPSTMSVGQKVYLSKAAAEAAGANVVVEKVKPKEPEKITEKKAKEIEKEIAVDGPVYHIVVKGETLYGITKRYGITAEQLKKWNGLESITIKIGQKLQVSE
jgi:membrane-bound lytic murein transglycosylase D